MSKTKWGKEVKQAVKRRKEHSNFRGKKKQKVQKLEDAWNIKQITCNLGAAETASYTFSLIRSLLKITIGTIECIGLEFVLDSADWG